VPKSLPTRTSRLRCGLTRDVVPAGPDLWDAVGPVWCGLLKATSEPSAFLSPAWMETWLGSFAARAKPWAVVWRDADGRAVACVVLAFGGGRAGPWPVTRLYLNEPGFAVMPEHNDLLALPEHRAAVVRDLIDLAVETRTDETMLGGVRADLFTSVGPLWPGPTPDVVKSESPYVDLERVRAAGGDYLGMLSSNTRSQIRRSMRHYVQQHGDLALELAEGVDEKRQWLSDLIELHRAVWEARGEAGAFGPDARRFHERLIEHAEHHGGAGGLHVEMVRVRAGDRPIGMLYHLVRRGHVHFLQSGFRYEEDARFKPGLVTHCLSVESCLARGMREYDFLGGEPRSVRYKRSLSTDVRELCWGRLPAPSLKMRALERLREAKRRSMAGGTATQHL
jgi:CelD/BcsL family acetyltransferase involved in cellulose biosynthesis